jgi:crotonobetainyl-CoA:carnitine CoA-transferase CaiB-like acyl-CoA transferase
MFYGVNKGSSVIPQVGLGIQIDGEQSFCNKPPPTLGEDTRAVLKSWLSLSNESINELINTNIIYTKTSNNEG